MGRAKHLSWLGSMQYISSAKKKVFSNQRWHQQRSLSMSDDLHDVELDDLFPEDNDLGVVELDEIYGGRILDDLLEYYE